MALRTALITIALLTLIALAVTLLPAFPETSSIAGYLPLHSLLETMSIVVSMMVFAVGWNPRSGSISGNVVLLASAFFSVGLLDFLHTISYVGMPDFISPNDSQKHLNFWLAARFLSSVVLLVVALRPWQALRFKASRYVIFGSLVIVTALLNWVAVYHQTWLPDTFIPGQGLTAFKKNTEYLVIALNIAAAAILWRKMRSPQPFKVALIFGAVITLAMSEVFFTLYTTMSGSYNVLGHVYKVIAYLFIYRAIVVEAIELPYKQLKNSLDSLRESKSLLRSVVENAPVRIAWKDRNFRYLGCNTPFAKDAGYAKPDELIGRTDFEVERKEQAELHRAEDSAVMESGNPKLNYEETETTPDGNTVWTSTSKVPLRDENNQIVGILGIYQDITKRKQAETLLEVQKQVLEMIAVSTPFQETLTALVGLIEDQSPGILGYILLLDEDGVHLHHGAARSLPAAVIAALDGLPIGPCVGSCGTAAYRKEAVFVADIATDPLWANYKAVVLPHGLHACWSTPIFDAQGRVLGTFAMYYRQPGLPQPEHQQLIDATTHIASIAISRHRAESELLKLSLAVEQSPNSIVITDLDGNIEYVNGTFLRVTGYSRDEVIKENPRILQSGKTPKATYEDMWAHLTRGEIWCGEVINKRKDGSEYIELATISPVRQAAGRVSHYLAIKENITEQKQSEEHIERLAHFDQLTGLPNRSLLSDRFQYALSLAQRSGEPLAVMFLDLDHFKNINDTLGHTIGDQLLIEVAKRIKATLREEDTASRQGGDEFMLILHATDADGAAHVATKLLEAVAQPCQIEHYELITTISIGIAIYPHDGEDFETLSKNADTAMYRVKQSGRTNFCFYTPEMQANSTRTLLLANALRHALARDELQLHYQPQISIEDGHIVGAEALLRWRHPELGMISPAEFIPIAEDGGQIIPIGTWVLRTAARQLKDWMDRGLPPMVVAVNLSSVQFRQANITEHITRILEEVQLPHEYIEIELTEAVAMDDPLAAIEVMDKLHECGVRMSIDDFGTGYSSLSYLKKFKAYKLKIDQSFVRDIADDSDDKAIVSAIINMASSLGIQTIAEGVETAEQLAFLRLQGCNEVQGYYFSKPLPADEFEAYVRQMK